MLTVLSTALGSVTFASEWWVDFKGGSILSKEVLWVSMATKLQTVKFGGSKKILSLGHLRTKCRWPGFYSQIMGSFSQFDGNCNFAAL